MNKIIRHILRGSGLILLISACGPSEDENICLSGENEVCFTSGIRVASRATSTAFEDGDAISVFAFKDASGFAGESYASNRRYIYNGGRFAGSGTEDAIVYPQDESSLAFQAIYPYQAAAGASFSFEVKEDQSINNNYTLSDLMSASTASTTDLTPHLSFSHRLSNIILNLSFDEAPAGSVHVDFQHVTSTASVDMLTGTYKGVGEQTKTIRTASNGTNSYRAVLPPQPLEGGTALAVITTDAGDSYTWRMPKTTEWKSGIQYTYDLHIDKEGAVTFMFTIDPWNESDIKKDILFGRWAWVHDKGWERYDGYFEEWDDYYTDTNPYFFFFYADGTGFDSYDPEGIEQREEYTWELQGDKLTIHVKGDPSAGEDDETQVVTIMKLTPATLELEYSEPEYYSYVTLEKR